MRTSAKFTDKLYGTSSSKTLFFLEKNPAFIYWNCTICSGNKRWVLFLKTETSTLELTFAVSEKTTLIATFY